jgi:hypothetical protein
MARGNDLDVLRRHLLEQTQGTPEREAYLEQLAQRVRSGSYKVNADELAASLLRHFDKSGPQDPNRKPVSKT